MTVQDMLTTAEAMEKRIESADASARLALQPEFHRILQRIRADGGKVPFRLRRLEAMLCEEATEAQFDNMPV
jgi:hypothetical protein